MKEFNSQVCTTREQSLRLLELGLKPETADMYIFDDEVYIGKPNVDDIPAWSLHRLMEILDSPLIEFNTLTYNPYEEIIDLISECLKLKLITNKEYLKQ